MTSLQENSFGPQREDGYIRDFNKKVAIITGGASGIGFALARRALQEDMSVVLADVEDRVLDEAKVVLSEDFGNDRVPALHTDVSRAEDSGCNGECHACE